MRTLDRWADATERRLGLTSACVVGGLALLAVAALYTSPAFRLANNGLLYGYLSEAPLDFSRTNQFHYRILAPLIGWALFLRGPLFLFVPLLMAVAFLALTLFASRRRGFSGSESLAVGALIALSSPILFELHFQGYSDTTSYALLLLAMLAAERSLWLWSLPLGLALLSHESNGFLGPWFVFHALQGRFTMRRLLGAALAGIVALLPALAFRYYAYQHIQPAFSIDFYLSSAFLRRTFHENAPGYWLGVFMAFKFFWFLPLHALGSLVYERRYAEATSLALALLCTFATTPFESDLSRMMGLAFPAILLAAWHLRDTLPQRRYFAVGLWLLIALNCLVPQYYVGQSRTFVFLPLPVALVLRWVFGVDTWAYLWWG